MFAVPLAIRRKVEVSRSPKSSCSPLFGYCLSFKILIDPIEKLMQLWFEQVSLSMTHKHLKEINRNLLSCYLNWLWIIKQQYISFSCAGNQKHSAKEINPLAHLGAGVKVYFVTTFFSTALALEVTHVPPLRPITSTASAIFQLVTYRKQLWLALFPNHLSKMVYWDSYFSTQSEIGGKYSDLLMKSCVGMHIGWVQKSL